MAYNTPENLSYTKEHEWTFIEGDIVTIGVTDFAQSSLGEVVFVELPQVGDKLEKDQPFGVIESIKSVSDLYAPLSGEVQEVNEGLSDQPELVNQNPYDSWLVKIKLHNSDDISALMNSKQYAEHCESSS